MNASQIDEMVSAHNAKWKDVDPLPATRIVFSRDRSMRCIGYVGDHLIAAEPIVPFELITNMDAAFDAFEAAGSPDYFEWRPSA